MSKGVHISFWISFCFLHIPRSGISRLYVDLWGTSTLFPISIVVAPIYIPPSSAFSPHPHLVICFLFDNSHSNMDEVRTWKSWWFFGHFLHSNLDTHWTPLHVFVSIQSCCSSFEGSENRISNSILLKTWGTSSLPFQQVWDIFLEEGL